jgi:WD40 repeat protein
MPGTRSARGERVWGTAVSSDGRYAIHITTGRRAILTNLAQDQEFELSKKGLTCVAFFAEGDAFIAGSSDGQVTLWSAATAKPSQVLYSHNEAVRSVAVSPRGDMIAMGSPDGSVHLIDPANDHAVIEVSRNESAVNCVRFAPDGRHLAAAVGDWSSSGPGKVMIWNVQSGQLSSVLNCAGAPGAVSFASTEELIVGQWNGQISLWNLKRKEIVGSAMADKNLVTASSFSPDNPSLQEVPFFPTRQHTEVADIQR